MTALAPDAAPLAPGLEASRDELTLPEAPRRRAHSGKRVSLEEDGSPDTKTSTASPGKSSSEESEEPSPAAKGRFSQPQITPGVSGEITGSRGRLLRSGTKSTCIDDDMAQVDADDFEDHWQMSKGDSPTKGLPLFLRSSCPASDVASAGGSPPCDGDALSWDFSPAASPVASVSRAASGRVGPGSPAGQRRPPIITEEREGSLESDAEAPPGLLLGGLPPDVPLSRGSADHHVGGCSPCAWIWKLQGCLRGHECGYCHLCPEGEIKARKKAKQVASRVTGPGTSQDEAADDEALANLEGEVPEEPTSAVDVQPPAVPKAPEARPSIGSEQHGAGTCRPCAWFWKARGCQNGRDCRHCHLCPDGEIRSRKRVKVDALRQEKGQDPTDEDDDEDEEEQQQKPQKEGWQREPCVLDFAAFEAIGVLSPKGAASPSLGFLDASSDPLHVPLSSILPPADPIRVPVAAAIPPPPGLPMPSTPPLALRSVGSSLHGSGQCRPCAWLWKPEGCRNGLECRHCHICPEGEIKNRRKVKVDTLRKSRSDDDTDDEDGDDIVAECFASTGPSKLELFPHIAFPNPGSSLHGTGSCRPCAWFWKTQGCANGSDCRHCHLCAEGEIKARRKSKASTQRVQETEYESPKAKADQQPARITLSITEQLFFAPNLPVQLDLASSLAPPPAGSAHALGHCRPCAWLWKPQGCLNGEECGHCHLCPAGELKSRRRAKEPAQRPAPAATEPRMVQIAPTLGA